MVCLILKEFQAYPMPKVNSSDEVRVINFLGDTGPFCQNELEQSTNAPNKAAIAPKSALKLVDVIELGNFVIP